MFVAGPLCGPQLLRVERLDLAEFTQILDELSAKGRYFQVVERAQVALSQFSHAPAVVRLVLHALVKLELGGPARELMQIRGDWSVSEFDSACVSSLPNGRVPWSEQAELFKLNRDVLLQRQPWLSKVLQDFPDALTGLQLFRTKDGDYQLSLRRQAGALRPWLPALTDDDPEGCSALPPRGRLGVPLVLGVRNGRLIQKLIEDTRELFLSYSHPIYLVEPDVGRFAAWLHSADHTAVFEDPRIYLFVGQQWLADLAALLQRTSALPLATVHVSLWSCPEVAREAQAVMTTISTQRERELKTVSARVQEVYAVRDFHYWARRFERPGRVLGVTSRFTTMLQYSMRDTLSALGDMGYETHTVIEQQDHHQASGVQLLQTILEFDPDFVIYLDHLRYESPHMPANLPLLSWIQDPMDNLLCPKAGESIGPLDFVCGYYQERCCADFGYPADQFVYTDIPVSTHEFHDGDLDAATQEKYDCDICFVSNASTAVEQFAVTAQNQYPVALRPLLKVLTPKAVAIDDRVEYPMTAAVMLVREEAGRLGVTLDGQTIESIATNYVYRIYDWGRRQETLEWVARWARASGHVFKIYGRGWESHPTLAPFAAGVLEHGDDLRCAYRAARLALQLIPSGFRHQRSYEMLAAGVLPLTRRCQVDFEGEESAVVLFPGFDRIVFDSPQSFDDLAELHLRDEHRRRQILTAFREVMMAKFTYTSTLSSLMGKWVDYFRDRTSEHADQDSPSQGAATLSHI